MSFIRYFTIIFFANFSFAKNLYSQTLNVYIWGNQIPRKVFQKFEQDTGIHVNVSTFDSNETMYTKLKITKGSGYDLVMPSSYYVQKLQKNNLLLALDHNKLPHLKELDSFFLHHNYDYQAQYSVPLLWGATGIFYNPKYIKIQPKTWNDLWLKNFKAQLLMLDDAREVFSIALLSLGYSPNDQNIYHIEKAYEKLLKLINNIKLFSNDGIQAIISDEDAWLGMSWNGDILKASQDNNKLKFVLPQDGYIIWIDCLAIPKSSNNIDGAHKLIDYLISASVAKKIALHQGYAITNKLAKNQLPNKIKNNRNIYPSSEDLKRAVVQEAIDDKFLQIYNSYWQKFKLSF